MKNYRDILIFPKFNNIDKIQKIRKECDEIYEVIDPHITIVFPFLDDISDEKLIDNVSKIINEINKFDIKFNGISYSDDDYIFLNCIEGKEEIIKLHDLLYDSIFQKFESNREYIPHITIGQKYNCKNGYNPELQDIFETTIDKICIEKIGDNQESIIIKEFILK